MPDSFYTESPSCIEVKMTHLCELGKCSCMNAQCRKFTENIFFIFATQRLVEGCILHGYLAPAILSHISCPSWLLLIMMIPFHKGPGPHRIPQRLQIARRNIQSISLPNFYFRSCLYKVVVFIND